MKRLLRSLLFATILLLAACSADGATTQSPTPVRTARTAPNASQPQHNLPGRLLYVRDKQIWVHEGTGEHALKIEGEVRDPAWSPDGRSLAFVRRDESFSDLFVLNTETSQATQVTSNGSQVQKRTQEYVHQIIWAAKPTWSPDGKEIVFLSQKQPATGEGQQPAIYEYPLSLYRYKTRLIGQREPTNADLLGVGQDGADILSPVWSPDGRFLAYVQAPRDDKPRAIMLYDFESEQAKPFPGIPNGAYDPAWSPDGRKLAFAISQDGATDIWTIEGTDNGTPQRLTTLGRARSPEWSPDGTTIAFINVADDGTNLYTVSPTQQNGRLEGRDPVQITDGENIDAGAGLSWAK